MSVVDSSRVPRYLHNGRPLCLNGQWLAVYVERDRLRTGDDSRKNAVDERPLQTRAPLHHGERDRTEMY